MQHQFLQTISIDLFSMQGFLLLGMTMMDKYIPIKVKPSSDDSETVNSQHTQEESNGQHSSCAPNNQAVST